MRMFVYSRPLRNSGISWSPSGAPGESTVIVPDESWPGTKRSIPCLPKALPKS